MKISEVLKMVIYIRQRLSWSDETIPLQLTRLESADGYPGIEIRSGDNVVCFRNGRMPETANVTINDDEAEGPQRGEIFLACEEGQMIFDVIFLPFILKKIPAPDIIRITGAGKALSFECITMEGLFNMDLSSADEACQASRTLLDIMLFGEEIPGNYTSEGPMCGPRF